MIKVSIQQEMFDLEAELAPLKLPKVGAVVSFQGLVRDSEGELIALELEHYPAMTKAAINEFCEHAAKRWALLGIVVVHRVGRLEVGEPIMMVGTASAHRRDAFEAVDFLMDYLKSRAPFWKKEHTKSGSEWVAAKAQDEDDLKRWDH